MPKCLHNTSRSINQGSRFQWHETRSNLTISYAYIPFIK
jgi:hypothetical protein